MAISVNIGKDRNHVSIYVDREGVENLIAQLKMLDRTDHVHLFSRDWGDGSLSSHPGEDGSSSVHMLTVYERPSSEFHTEPRAPVERT